MHICSQNTNSRIVILSFRLTLRWMPNCASFRKQSACTCRFSKIHRNRCIIVSLLLSMPEISPVGRLFVCRTVSRLKRFSKFVSFDSRVRAFSHWIRSRCFTTGDRQTEIAADKSSLMDLSKRVSLSGITKFVPSRENVAIKTCLNPSSIYPDSLGQSRASNWQTIREISLVDFTIVKWHSPYDMFFIFYEYIFFFY